MIPTDCSEPQFSWGSPGWEDPHFLTSGSRGTETCWRLRDLGWLCLGGCSLLLIWNAEQPWNSRAFSFSDYKPCLFFVNPSCSACLMKTSSSWWSTGICSTGVEGAGGPLNNAVPALVCCTVIPFLIHHRKTREAVTELGPGLSFLDRHLLRTLLSAGGWSGSFQLQRLWQLAHQL